MLAPDDPWVTRRADRKALLHRLNLVASLEVDRVSFPLDDPRFGITGCTLRPRAPREVAPGPVPEDDGATFGPTESIPLAELQPPAAPLVRIASSAGVRPEWPWDLDQERARIGGCESTVVVAWTGSDGPDAWQPVVLRCGSRLCPVCWAARAGRAVHR